MMLQKPWHRDNRATVTKYDGRMYLRPSENLFDAVSTAERSPDSAVVPIFEVAATVPSFQLSGNLSCIGGGAVAGLRANDFWQWTLEVTGCTLGNSLPHTWSGDSLTFTAGPQWVVHTAGRWSPHAHFRIGGQKITEKKADPTKRQEVLSHDHLENQRLQRNLYTQRWESTGISLSAGAGLDVAMNRALALRVANIEYLHSSVETLNGNHFDRGLRFSAGLVLRVGPW